MEGLFGELEFGLKSQTRPPLGLMLSVKITQTSLLLHPLFRHSLHLNVLDQQIVNVFTSLSTIVRTTVKKKDEHTNHLSRR